MIWHYKYYIRFTNRLYNGYDSKILVKEIYLPYLINHHKTSSQKKNCLQALFEEKFFFISTCSIQLDEQ